MNPFAHKDIPYYWIVSITPEEPLWCDYFLESLAELSDVVVIQDKHVILYYETQADMADIERRCAILADAVSINAPVITETQHTNHPHDDTALYSNTNLITIGSYKIGNVAPNHALHLQCHALKSFGDGAHPTTYCCLNTIHELSKSWKPERIIDMGCGSGILSLLMARLWPHASIAAIDQDPYAVSITQQNTNANKLNRTLKTFVSDGYQSPKLSGSYDFIVANLLLNLHIDMLREVVTYLKPNGRIIISGILNHQENSILSHYRAFGFILEKRKQHDGWSSLLLRKHEDTGH
ncbi:MAG: 50S ribosomal protein L11 methyltransferase [Rickettsiales bacterium]|nr:50S ribosomal protein L11 methyltransferase [Rickettsiales bacterium]